jgi:hypothetical protein
MSNAYPLIHPQDVHALVIHCSDPRFQEAFHQFIKQDLGIEHCASIVVPGGIHDLVSPVRLKAARHLWDQVDFIIRMRNIRRIVIINHEDCLWYAKWNALVRGKVSEEILHHLILAGEKIVEKRYAVEVDIYLAKIHDGQVVFQKISR